MSTENLNSSLVSGRLLARNTVWNLVGQVLPMVVGIVTIPVIIRGMGEDRFGVLSLAWVVLGYFSFFDLGIGRALTKLVADKLAANEDSSIPPLAGTAMLLMLGLGSFGAVVTLLISPVLVHHLLKIPQGLQNETLHGFYLLAGSIPVVTVTAGLRGILEALQRFRIVNLIRIPMSVFSFAAPLAILPFSRSVAAVIGILMVGRLIACAAHLFACLRFAPQLWHFSVDFGLAGPLLKVGGWMTLSNVCGPALLYVDRFVISTVLSISAVTYYTAPFDMISRVTVIPLAFGGVLFPAFAVCMVQEPKRAGLLLERGIKYVFMIVFPATLIAATFAPEILQLWLGAGFAQHSASVLRWLALGMLMNSLTVIPLASLQGIGRSDIAGKVLLLDLLVYVVVLFAVTKHFGIGGTAIAWAGRATTENLVFFGLNRFFLPKGVLPLRSTALCFIGALGVFYSSALIAGFAARIVFVILTLAVFSLGSWFLVLEMKERLFLTQVGFRGILSSLRQRASVTGQ
jgi:O-antigen/teichoic acid export membrane protein